MDTWTRIDAEYDDVDEAWRNHKENFERLDAQRDKLQEVLWMIEQIGGEYGCPVDTWSE